MESTGSTIIVVEDEPGTRATLCGILMEDAGYQVIGLERGTEALEMIRKSPFDVIIADIRLPDVSGLEILELAKETNPDAAVIMMTGYASMETAVEAVNQGAYAYFVKPVNPDEMKTTIANALKQQRLSLENKKLIGDLQRTNKLLLEANEELRNEITERKRMEEALRESEGKYRALVENATDFITDCQERLGLAIAGLMCIPPVNEDPQPHFELLATIARQHGIVELSMGMSGEFATAIKCGATYVRVGSAIFGSRG